jgi:hypothetical protein
MNQSFVMINVQSSDCLVKQHDKDSNTRTLYTTFLQSSDFRAFKDKNNTVITFYNKFPQSVALIPQMKLKHDSV